MSPMANMPLRPLLPMCVSFAPSEMNDLAGHGLCHLMSSLHLHLDLCLRCDDDDDDDDSDGWMDNWMAGAENGPQYRRPR